MDQGQSSSAADQGVTVTESLVTEMAQRLRTPAPEVDASVVCLISWAGSDGFDRRDYEPANVRIGPFHRDPSHPTENEKKDALHHLLPHDDEQGRADDLNHYLDEMARVVPRARGCYSRWFSTIDTEEFKCMLLVDGCFLHSRFVPSRAAPAPVNDDISVDRDIVFLLENQLPFFVLVEVQKLITADAEDNYSVVVDNVLGRIQALVRLNEYSAVTVPRPTTPPCHLLHLLHMYFRPTSLPLNDAPAIPRTRSAVAAAPTPSSQPAQIPMLPLRNNQGAAANGNGAANEVIPPPPGAPVRQTRWRAATYYHTAGVRFMERKVGSGDGEARSILDVERRGDWLHIPILAVDNNTFRMLRNMVALEQNSPQLRSSHVTAYCLFMSQLASTKEDVELLVAKGVIVHLLHSADDVAANLAGLCDGVVLDAYNPDLCYLRAEHAALEEVCRDGWKKSKAWLRHTKCNNYLMGLAVLAGAGLFFCTVEQSVFAALSYFQGKK
ncbi:unnamed protein product [Triticum turgidum subsp. durum]|uniref:Uncharacterized protein n=1 Tax=Triticum turgidum subsp. durum TaxID=4567 RepID=A0A9R1A2C9_TRITD|nr:unnamed protein product [Triticum turgidum subsp. durum]